MPTDFLRPGTASRLPGGATSAFTLVELMVAIAIFTLLVVLLAYASRSVSNLWVSTRESSSRQQSERAILDFVARDLEGALLPIIRTDPKSLQFVRNPSTVSDPYRSGDTLFWQAPIATDVTRGDIAVVGYFVKWVGTKASLCRLFVNPTETANYRINTSPGDWINDGVLASAAPADKASGYTGLMAENIVGFWAQPLDVYGRAILVPPDFDSRATYTDSSGKTFPTGCLPPAVKISIAVIDSQRASRLSGSLQTLANSSTDAEDFIGKVSANPAFAGISPGLRAYSTSIALINSR
jgi:prepilin-type N-terminal cleavage/methylation domain-containing protein